MSKSIEYYIVRYTMKLNNIKLLKQDIDANRRLDLGDVLHVMDAETIKAIIAYYENKIEELKALATPQFTNVRCVYTGGGIWVYIAQYGPCWLMGELGGYINAYDEYKDLADDDVGDYDYEGHCVDKYIKMPTWAEILDSLKPINDANYSEWEYITKKHFKLTTPCNEDDDDGGDDE